MVFYVYAGIFRSGRKSDLRFTVWEASDFGFLRRHACSVCADHCPTGLGSNRTVSYEHNGEGFNAINLDFDRSELDAVINKIKENIFTEELDAGVLPQEVAEVMKKKEHSTTRTEETEGKETQNAVIDLLLSQPSKEERSDFGLF